MDRKFEILQDLKTHLIEHLGSEVSSLILFGSQANNSEHAESDYDILIIMKNRQNWMKKDKIIDLCYEIDLKHDIIIDPHIISEDELNTLRGRQPIYTTAMQRGIRV